jgi:hypothetical protein
MNSKYLEFLKSKIETAPVSGFSVPEKDINPALKPHQRDAVRWALRGGRRALFESFGLGKSAQELEFCHHAAKHEGKPALPRSLAGMLSVLKSTGIFTGKPKKKCSAIFLQKVRKQSILNKQACFEQKGRMK